MRLCLSCQQPIPTLQDVRKAHRSDWTLISVILLLVLLLGGLVGYGVRDSVFLKRENTMLSSLLDKYVKRVETDKLVTENQALRTKKRGE